MSKIGKSSFLLPRNIKLNITKNVFHVKGPLGELQQTFPSQYITIQSRNNKIHVYMKVENCKKYYLSFHGLYRSLFYNMIIGVTKGFTKTLEVIGVGYRVISNKNILELNLGYSHNIVFKLPQEVQVNTQNEKGKNPLIILKSHDKQLLGILAHKIRSLRKPEPYKGKGIRYLNEIVLKKAGKSIK